MASLTNSLLGDPVGFFRNGKEIFSTSGVYLNEQETKRSKSKVLRVVDCDVVTCPYSDLVKPGDECRINNLAMSVAGNPVRDGSGGMIVKLTEVTQSNGGHWLDR